MPHLCRTGAAPASPTVVEGNDGWFHLALQNGIAGGEITVDAVAGISSDQVDVKVSDWLTESTPVLHNVVVVALLQQEL